MSDALFEEYATAMPSDQRGRDSALEQYFLHSWAANLLLTRFFPCLARGDVVADFGTGLGAFLGEVPQEVDAYGIEIDPQYCEIAAERTGRPVICGDVRYADVPARPTAIISNPPWRSAAVHAFLGRGYELLQDGGRMGALLPVHFFGYSSTVLRLMDKWSIDHTLLPKSLFNRLRYPLMFAVFTKERIRTYHGLALFAEAKDIAGAAPEMKGALANGGRRRSVWREIVERALRAMGGRATSEQIRDYVFPRRPVAITTWKDTLRRVLNEGPFSKDSDGYWHCTQFA